MHMSLKVRRQLEGVVSLRPHWSTGHQTQVVRLGSRHLYLPSVLTALLSLLLKNVEGAIFVALLNLQSLILLKLSVLFSPSPCWY